MRTLLEKLVQETKYCFGKIILPGEGIY